MNESKPYNGLLGLDILPAWVKIAIWLLVFALLISRGFFLAVGFEDGHFKVPFEYAVMPIAIMTNCFAGAGLRLTGIRWRYVFLFWLATFLYLITIWKLSPIFAGFVPT